MRCPKQLIAAKSTSQQMQVLQHLGVPGVHWPPCPPQPVYNPWMMPPQYPMASPMPPFPQLPPQVPAPGERPFWFQALVEAVSDELKHHENKAAAGKQCGKAGFTDLSDEDEKTLVSALQKQKDGGSTMQQVFEELSRKSGHSEIVWKTWFIANFERLNSKIVLIPSVAHESITLGQTGSFRSSCSGVASRTRSSPNAGMSGPSTNTMTSEQTHSREGDSDSEPEWVSDDVSSDDQSSTSTRVALRPRTKANGNCEAASVTRPARGGRQPARVTDADLRAMALYRFEKGDDSELRRYGTVGWREFAQRPENHKRSLAAWTCIPRSAAHAAAIDEYVKEHQLLAEGTVDSKAGLADLLSNTGAAIPSPGAGMPRSTVGTSMNETAGSQRGSGAEENRERVSRIVVPEDVIDLTTEGED